MIVINGYIVAVAATDDNRELLVEKIQNKPTDPDGYTYKLRADDLEWELVELPPVEEPELTADEALDIILGGGEA